MEVSRREIFRYLGYGQHKADEAVKELVEECLEELERASAPKSVARAFPLKLLPGDGIDFTCFQTESRNLRKNLGDCHQAILFAATLGAGVDLLIQRYAKLQISKAVTMDAAATAYLEEYCDQENASLKAAYEAKGLYLRPRFSPGYGDFPLECQRQMTAVLETGKRIGITLTDSLLMAPAKSVTAVMGVSQRPYRCTIKGCEACGKTDCQYRRG